MEGIGDERSPQRKTDLVARHSGLELGNHLLRYKIPLLDVVAIGRNKPGDVRGYATTSKDCGANKGQKPQFCIFSA